MRRPDHQLTERSDVLSAATPWQRAALLACAGLSGVAAVLIADLLIPALAAWQMGGGL